MRRSAFVGTLGGALGAALLPRAARAAGAGPVRIFVLGDSLALGTGATRADGGFIFLAYRAILSGRPGSMLDNVAIGGTTVADVVRLELPRLDGEHPDVVVVCVGGNDVVRQTPADAFARSYRTLLHGIAQRAPEARIVCCGVPDVGVSPLFSSERDLVQSASAADDRAARSAASAAGAAFVDLYAVSHAQMNASRFLGRDHFHPSDQGYVLLAGVLTPVLQRAVANLPAR